MKKGFIIVVSLLMLLTAASAQEQPTKPRRTKVACVGNSITEGVGSGDRELYSYPAQLQELLGQTYRVRNYGKSGHTLMTSGDRPWVKTDKYRDAKMWKPAIVIIKLGTNDSKPINNGHIADDFRRDLLALVDSFTAMPSVQQIYLCTPAPCVQENRYNIQGEVISQQIVPIVREVADERHLPLIDLHTALTGHADLFPDHVHPNREGARLIAETVHEALTRQQKP